MSIPALVATFAVMAVFDGIWLTVGAWFFATQPGVDDGSVLTGALRGAAFGFVAYATYDLTNHATLRNWPTLVTIVDMAWGTFLTAAVAGIATWITLTFFAG
jgi:uncharacterized membrane protein